MVVGDGPERAALERLAARARAGRARALPRRAAARGGACASRSRPACSCCRASTRRSASPTSRRWPAACPAIGCRGEPGPEEIARARRRHAARPARRPRGARGELRALLDEPSWRRELGDAARAVRRGDFTWERCGARDGRGLRGGAAVTDGPDPPARPVRHQPRAAVPGRRVRARCTTREDVVFALVGGDVRHGGGGTPATRCRSRRSASPQRAVAPARGVGPLPRGRRRALGSRRAPGRLPGRPRRHACRSSCGRRSGAIRARRRTRCPICRCATSTAHADAIATYGPHCQRLRAAPRARAAPVVEAPQSVDDRVLAQRRPSPTGWRRSRSCSPAGSPGEGRRRAPARLARLGPAAPQPRSSWSAEAVRPGPRHGRDLPGRLPPENSATSTRAATSWSYRRSPRATSSSRGGWSSTKPSTRESP